MNFNFIGEWLVTLVVLFEGSEEVIHVFGLLVVDEDSKLLRDLLEQHGVIDRLIAVVA